MATKTIFCANDQTETKHTLAVDANNEVVATCDCGYFIKAPADLSVKEINAFFAAHSANDGQVKVDEKAEAEAAAKAEDLINKLAD